MRHTTGSFRCGNNCITCHYITDGRTNYTFSTTGETRTIPDHIDCNSKNLIYMVHCLRCNKQYIGETKRRLKDRFNEHRRPVDRRARVRDSAGQMHDLFFFFSFFPPYELCSVPIALAHPDGTLRKTGKSTLMPLLEKDVSCSSSLPCSEIPTAYLIDATALIQMLKSEGTLWMQMRPDISFFARRVWRVRTFLPHKNASFIILREQTFKLLFGTKL